MTTRLSGESALEWIVAKARCLKTVLPSLFSRASGLARALERERARESEPVRVCLEQGIIKRDKVTLGDGVS